MGLLVSPVWLWHPSLLRDQQKVPKRHGPAALVLLLGGGLHTSFPPSGLETVLCTEGEKMRRVLPSHTVIVLAEQF